MANDLRTYRSNITSEHGEDGIIAEIFRIIGPGQRWCVELGALNGVHGSNTWQLLKKQGWSGVLIEADRTQFQKLQTEYADVPGAHCVNAFVSFEGEHALDQVFARTPLPREFDLFSLDIDGNEYHLWESMQHYHPRVMLVEFNPSIPNDVMFVQPRDMQVFQGSSLQALCELGKRKGYELVACTDVNAFFIRKELFPMFGIEDNSLDVLHTDTSYQTKLFQLYDGTLRIAGNKRLIWHNREIDEHKLQVLSTRAYPARINASGVIRTVKYYARRLPIYPLIQHVRKLWH